MIDFDDHMDDACGTESNASDNEMVNNLTSFKYGAAANTDGRDKNLNVADSDVDSDAGSVSNRFSLGLQQMHSGCYQSDSENESDASNFLGRRNRGKEDPLDDIDDISEHSSDDIESSDDDI